MALTIFPSTGWCKTKEKDIRQYLVNRINSKPTEDCVWTEKHIGVGWNETSHWLIITNSSKQEYKYEDLKKFFSAQSNIPEYVKLNKGWSVEDEFMGEIFELSTLDNLKKFKNSPSKEDFRNNINAWIKEGNFEISTKKEYLAQQNTDKWCIKATEENIDALNQYLKDNKDKYPSYQTNWKVSLSIHNQLWFYSKQISGYVPRHSETLILPDFTLITTEQFKEKYPQYFETEYIIGKWYKIISGAKANYRSYIKVSKIVNNNIYYENERYIDHNNTWQIGTRIDEKDIRKSELLTDLSEIQEYLPDGHPDKEIKSVNMQDILEECKLRFPAGTKFKCANGNVDDLNDSKYGSKKGIFEVIDYKVMSNPSQGVHSGNGWLWLRGKYAEIISLSEENYKIGDWVVMITNSGRNKKGEIGQITEITNNDFRVKTKSSLDNSGNWCVNHDVRKALQHEISNSKRKYHISEFTSESNLVIRCTNAEQGNKIALIFDPIYPKHNFQGSENFICWIDVNFNNDYFYSWDLIKHLKPEQIVIEFDDVIFDALTQLEPVGDGIWNQIRGNYNYIDIKSSFDEQYNKFQKTSMWPINSFQEKWQNDVSKIYIKNRTKKPEENSLPKRVRLINNRNKFLKTKNK